MCDNCSPYAGDTKPRDFTFEDIAATLLRHDVPARVDAYALGWYRSFLLRHHDTKSTEDLVEYVRDKMFQRGHSYNETTACENLYKEGLKVLEIFKQKGIQHQPRKR